MADEILQANEVVSVFTNSAANTAHQSDDTGDVTALGKRLVLTNGTHAAVGFQWTNLNASDGQLTVQCSVPGTTGTYVQKTTATIALTAGSGVNSFSLNDVVSEKFYRIIYTPGANSTGTLNVQIYLKTAS